MLFNRLDLRVKLIKKVFIKEPAKAERIINAFMEDNISSLDLLELENTLPLLRKRIRETKAPDRGVAIREINRMISIVEQERLQRIEIK